ncbi:MAG: hypothetical protein KDK23_04900 [Leptospiraceae bacterium]|nr:hypothetical protein [Leptospiraceae bacterium]
MKLRKTWVFSGLAALAFLGLSITIYEVNTYRIDRPTELRFDFSGIKPAEAGESAWGGVRQSVTWANNNGALIDSVLTALNNVGFFGWPDGTVLKRVNVQMGTFLGKIQLDRGASSSAFSISCSACASNQDFRNRLIIWRQSDGEKAMELYFNDYGDTSGSGAIVIYRTKILNPDQFNGSDTYVESWVKGASGSKRQTYSWRDGPLISGGVTDRARVFLEEMDGGSLLCVKAVIQLTTTAASEFNSIPGCSGNNPLYYAVAYGQKTVSPFETTAKVALWSDGGGEYGTEKKLCSFTHSFDYGLFNGNGFIEDGVSSANIPSGFRAGSNIDTLVTEIGTVTTAYEDLRKATVNGLGSGNINFKGPATAPTADSGP